MEYLSSKSLASLIYYKFYNEISIIGMNNEISISKGKAKKCALIHVNGIISEFEELDKYEHVPEHLINEWKQVKKELELL